MTTAPFRRAFRDFKEHLLLNGIAILTVTLSVAMAAGFSLVQRNIDHWLKASESGIHIMVFLKNGLKDAQQADVATRIQKIVQGCHTRIIGKDQALLQLKQQLKQQEAFLDGLSENPLPDAIDVTLSGRNDTSQIETAAKHIRKIPDVEDVEYAEAWLNRYNGILKLFRFTGLVLGVLFYAASGLIIANTIRLMMYSRLEEVEIMKLIGATDFFIKAPFYIQSVLQGIIGGLLGLVSVFTIYRYVSSRLIGNLPPGFCSFRFLDWKAMGLMIGCCAGVGIVGCYFSMKHFWRH